MDESIYQTNVKLLFRKKDSWFISCLLNKSLVILRQRMNKTIKNKWN